ncbi:MAG TPA: mobile mystery protein A [Candidatus Obscuribacterales bacterium]
MPKFSARLRRRQLDQMLVGIQLPHLRRGYIREIRDALEMSSFQLAERMGISRSSVKQLEESEQSESITLKSLRRAAEALGCDLVYALVPKTSLDDIVKRRAHEKAQDLSAGVERTMALEQQTAGTSDTQEMVAELADEILRKGGRELWR